MSRGITETQRDTVVDAYDEIERQNPRGREGRIGGMLFTIEMSDRMTLVRRSEGRAVIWKMHFQYGGMMIATKFQFTGDYHECIKDLSLLRMFLS